MKRCCAWEMSLKILMYTSFPRINTFNAPPYDCAYVQSVDAMEKRPLLDWIVETSNALQIGVSMSSTMLNHIISN